MSGSLTFSVIGTPIPKGSTRAFVPKGWNRAVITNANAKTKPYQQAVVAEIMAAINAQGWRKAPAGTPIAVGITFYMPRPKTAPKSVVMPCKKPDLDKLTRLVLDACTQAGVYDDDSQVVQIGVRKSFVGSDEVVLPMVKAVVMVFV